MWGSSIQSNHLFGPQLQVSNQTQIQFKSRLHQATWHKNTIPHCGETWLCALWPGAWCSYWRGSHHSDTHLLPGEDPEVWCWRKPVCARRRRSRQTIQWPGRERSKGCVSGFTINQSTTNLIELNWIMSVFTFSIMTDWLNVKSSWTSLLIVIACSEVLHVHFRKSFAAFAQPSQLIIICWTLNQHHQWLTAALLLNAPWIFSRRALQEITENIFCKQVCVIVSRSDMISCRRFAARKYMSESLVAMEYSNSTSVR